MKIIRLTASNVKRIRAVEITPEGNMVEIAGKNGQGKSSVLDSIWWALGGKRGIQRTPIREGEEHAEVTLDLGNIRVKRTWSADGNTTLKVFSASGSEETSPQGILDSLVGKLSFDPLEFARMDVKEQRSTLLRIVGLEDSLLDLEVRRSEIYEKRRETGRDVKRLEAEVNSIPPVPDAIPDQEENIEELGTELQKALELDVAITAEMAFLDKAAMEIDELETKLATLRHKKGLTELWLKEKVRPDIGAIKQNLHNAQEVNRLVQQKRRRGDVLQYLEDTQKQYGDFTGDIESLETEKRKALRAAKMPITALGVDFDGVTFNDLPFEQAADSEKLRVSMAVAMAMNPKLRVIRIMDGSLLDAANMKLVGEMAAENEYQIWIERVDPSSPSAVIIEDGLVKTGGKTDGGTES